MTDTRWIGIGASVCAILTLGISGLYVTGAVLPLKGLNAPEPHAAAVALHTPAAAEAGGTAPAPLEPPPAPAVHSGEHAGHSTPAAHALLPADSQAPGAALPGPALQQPQAAETPPAPPVPAKPAAPPKQAALTFDDGPDSKFTPQILDILKAHDVKATFFVVGRQAEKYPDVLKRIVQEGHALGNHSWDHADLSKLKPEQVQAEIAATDKKIEEITGAAPTLFRAPYGAVSSGMRHLLATLGRPLVAWTVDTRDWAGTPAEDIVQDVRRNTKPGGIILMHSFGGKNSSLAGTVEALPKVIGELQEAGFTLVTVPELGRQ